MEVNKEYESLEKFTADLSNLLQHDVVTVSGRLLKKGLVTKNVHDSMLTTEGVSSQRNAARLMSCVLDRVKCSSRCFHDFISVLREDAYYEDVVLKIIAAHTLLLSSPAPPTSEGPAPSSPPPSSVVCTVAEPSSSVNVNVVIERLDKQYIEIEKLVFKAIKWRKVPLEDILDWIRFPPATLRNQLADLVQTRVKLLANVSSIDELFFILSSYWNSLHPDLLGYLVNQLEDTDLKARMDRYMEDLHHFRIQTTLGDFLDKWVGEIPSGYKEFVLELGEEWRKKTVEDFEQFRIRLSRLQSFGGGHMSFMKTAKSSSILLLLALPAHLFPLNLRQKAIHNFFQDESVVRMMVDGQCIYDSKKLADCERELLKLCADEHSDITKIRHLLNQPAVDPNFYDEKGRSLLWWACDSGLTSVVTLLLDSGADVNLENDDELGETPLICASSHGHISVCRVLLEQGATVDYQDKDAGFTALRIASIHGHTEVAGVLIARGAVVDYQDKECAKYEGTHKQMKIFTDHKVTSLTELKRGSLIHLPSKTTPPTYTCSKHEGELKKLYCFTCSQLICRDCTLLDHPKDNGHRYDFVNSVASAFRSELVTKLLPIQDAHVAAMQAVSQLEESRKAITEQGEKSKQKIAREFNDLQAVLEKHKKLLLVQVGEATERKKNTLEKQQNKFNIVKSECEGVIEFVRLTSDSACDEDLVSVKADIEKRLQEVVIKTEHISKMIPAETAKDNNMIIATPSKDEFEKFINKQGFIAFLEGSNTRAMTGKRSIFMFHLTNTQDQPSLGSLTITAEVQSLTGDKAIVPATIRSKIPSVFEVSYTPNVRGRHQLIMQINSNETAMFPIFVSHPVTSLGTPVREIKSNRAWRIALSDNGDIYFTQQSIECYVHLDPKGSVKRIVQCIKNKFARGIEVESETGSIFISGSHKLQKYNSCGELVKEVGDVTPGARPGELHEPNDVRFHKNRIYICDSGKGRVQVFDPDLNYVHSFGTKGKETGQLHWPEDIDFDTDGYAYVVDSRRKCVLLFTPTYKLVREIIINSTLPTPSLRFPIALRIHGDYIFIGDAYQGVLACDKSTGKIIHHFSNSPVDVKGHSQIFPVGIAIDADGYVYICQRAKHCLSVY